MIHGRTKYRVELNDNEYGRFSVLYVKSRIWKVILLVFQRRGYAERIFSHASTHLGKSGG
jgi:hypothetical protein